MPRRKHIDVVCVAAIAFGVVLTILFMNGERLGLTTVVDADSEAHSDDGYFTENDLVADWDTSSATTVTLKGDTAAIEGPGAYVYDGNVVIGGSGAYVVSGELTNGSLVVDASENSKVWILLDGVTIRNEDDACVVVDEADKVFLTLAEGSSNSLCSGATYSDGALEDGTDGVIFAHDDLSINGGGSLVVTAEYGHAISANDDLVVGGGNISVTAPKDGIHANDSLRVANATLDVTAEDDGLAVSNDDAYIYVESGSVTVTAADEGMVATGDVTIAGGDVTISSGTESGHHGIKAGGTCTIVDGTIIMPACYEGIQANYIDIQGGDLAVYPADDGLNASSGSSDGMGGPMGGGMGVGRGDGGEPSAEGGQPAGGQPAGGEPSLGDTGKSSSTELPWIHVSGGSVLVVNESARDADGLDSNGDIIISGGDVRVSLNGNGSNSAIDYGSESGGVCEISGGTVVACGGYAMAEGFDSTSTQCSVLYNISSGIEAGQTISLMDRDGNVLLSYEVPCSFTSVSLSCPQMTLGETYYVVAGASAEAVTLNEVASSTGDVQSSMFGGGFNMGGGMQDTGNFEGGFGGRPDKPSGEDVDGDGQPQPQPPDGLDGDGQPQSQPPEAQGGITPEQRGVDAGDAADVPQNPDEDADDDEDVPAKKEYTTETLVICAISVPVLAAGLAVAHLVKRPF